jgi:hypothetical protein
MRVEHFAIDGSTVAIEAEADLDSGATAAGWAIVPSLMRAHPFTSHPPGYSTIVERHVRGSAPGLKLRVAEELSLKDGQLRIAEVELPTALGVPRLLTVGAWEGQAGCLTTSLVGHDKFRLVDVFDTIQFGRCGGRGLAITSQIVTQPRPPEVIKEIPGLGVLSIRPALAAELERVPRASGLATGRGELFRQRAQSAALLYVSPSAVVRVAPLRESCGGDDLLRIAKSLRIDWVPAAASLN